MTITGIITMLVVGTILGYLGRLVVPGRHAIPIWVTISVGIVAAFAGTLLARSIGVPTATSGIDWWELLLQILSAAIGVAVVAGRYRRREVRTPTNRPVIEPRHLPGRTPLSSPTPSSWPVPPNNEPDRLAFLADGPSRQRATTPPTQWPVHGDSESVPGPAPSRIFVSYRRTDSRHAARLIAERLRNHFGRAEVFMDVDSLDAGVDFVEGVLDAIRTSAVVLVLIGDDWHMVKDDRGRRRLDDPTDNVRAEIEHALRWRKPVLPVLLDGAGMPRPDELPDSLATLPRLNGIHLDHLSWDVDVGALIQAVTRLRS